MTGRHRTARLAAGLLAVVLIGAACDPAPFPGLPTGDLVGSPDPGWPTIGCDQASTRIQVTASARLDPDCTYRAGVDVVASHVTLDCQGATIDPGDDRGGQAIHVHSAAASPLVDVEVRNCVTRGFTNGIRVSRDGFRNLAAGHEYDTPTADIRLVNDDVSASAGTGVFVNAFVTGVTMRHLRVHDAGGPGIYLEAGSKGSIIENSEVIHNGYANTALPAQTMNVSGHTFAYLQTGREGIAVDGSRDNVIRHNVIRGNALAGITLYKNCGEYATQKPDQWWTRRYGASGNLIESNLVMEESSGVWIGSRMSENTYFFDCSDPAYVTGGLRTVILDSAPGNTVRGNLFVDTVHGVRVEDDDNSVTANTFVGDRADATHPAAEAVLVGTKERTQVLGRPVTGTVVGDNTADLVGVSDPYTWIYSPVAGLAPGVAPPIDAFLMVASIWLVA